MLFDRLNLCTKIRGLIVGILTVCGKIKFLFPINILANDPLGVRDHSLYRMGLLQLYSFVLRLVNSKGLTVPICTDQKLQLGRDPTSLGMFQNFYAIN
jgi:hypothetical protein